MASESETLNPSARIMTFYPTMEEFRNFSRYMAYIESQGAHRAGLAKVVPPKEWKPRASYDDIDDLVIPAPIQQLVTGQSGLFTQYNIQKKAMTVREFRKIANSDKYCTPRYSEFEELERKYWKNLTFNPPIYGADVNGTLYEKHVDEWNIGRLKTILDLVEKESGITIEGVNTPYLYFGMWKTSFAWHTEDMDLYSINYLHFGEPKSWYSVPPEHGKRLERLAKGFFPGSAQSCEAFLRHKMTLISPLMLKKYGIPFDKVTQEAGEFMITFPYGYHAGFNHGFNCAESTNFATRRWIEYGKQAVLCSCRKDMVKISMDVFVRKFQPERYKLWKAGKDSTVIDHTLPTPEAAEFLKESELPPRARNEECPEEDDMEGLEDGEEGDLKRSLAKHRIGTKRHRVCLEIPQEVSQSELFPKEELSPGQYDVTECQAALAPVRPTHSSVRQVDDALPFPDYSDSSEVKFEELKNVKLEEEDEEEEEEQEAAALDLSVNPASIGGRLVLSGSKKKSSSSLGSSSSRDSISSDSETSEPLSCRAQGQSGVLTVHSYAKGDGRVTMGEPCMRKKGGATGSISERELAEVADEYMFSLEENKKSKGRRQPLSKLPRHHPLVLQDCVSDDESSEQLAPEEEAEETEAWAKPLSQLWQNRPPNFEAEKEFNETMAQQAPHCAVCMIFQTYHQVEFGGLSQSCGNASALAPQKQRTKPLIPEMCFTSTGCSTDINLSTPYLEEDGTSLLVSCKKCSVRVHASCYGVPPAKASEDWMCSRCSANALEEDCCLCSLRGGALQRANDDRWVHVSCAVAILEARFVNIAERSPVDVSKIPLPRFKLRAKGALQSITAGQKVISKHKNGRFYQCEVVRLTTETFYEVNFDDGSFSDNLYPEDIVSQDCLQLGPPAEGEVVQVRWTDGQVYGAKFVASHPIQMYQVEFEDGSQLVVKRDDVYTLDEELPKRVKSRLSVASDMRFNEIFTEKEVKQEKKRQRVINSRYREDYIEPALYRAIME
ncbi:lysine-specific demethylase 4A isoform X2 [Ailuropoda melanoleuca]|uniref:lysine-specific demethylase 4A isoform X2 n=1 Tax=Ailuropoda melanoleuca TaxID=9646 RepID=UPI0014947B91|nr:lysine-specific demethylase 4A isoform X2 [Ailuropoda melanoleuca]